MTVRVLCALVCGLLWGEIGSAADVPVLLYHHIQDIPSTASSAARRWSISPEKFAEQMQWIVAHGFHPVTMEQLLRHIKYGQPLGPNPICITFDDGWKDHFTVVFPILKKYNFAATFFIITDALGHSAYMNWDQVRQMSDEGMDMQSHTLTHPKLATLPREQAWQEIRESKQVLQNHLNKPVTMLAYPYGSYSDAVIAMTKAAGYEGAAAVDGLNGGYLFRADQSYTLVRYAIEGGDNLAGIARVKGFAIK